MKLNLSLENATHHRAPLLHLSSKRRSNKRPHLSHLLVEKVSMGIWVFSHNVTEWFTSPPSHLPTPPFPTSPLETKLLFWIFSSALQLRYKDFVSVYPDYCWRVWLGSEQREHPKRAADWPEIWCFFYRLANSSRITASSEKKQTFVMRFFCFFFFLFFFGVLVTFLFDWELIFGLWTWEHSADFSCYSGKRTQRSKIGHAQSLNSTRQFPAQTLTGKPKKHLLPRKRSERKIEMDIKICKRKQKVGKGKLESFLTQSLLK